MPRFIFLAVLLICLSGHPEELDAQTSRPGKWFVWFSDKNDSPYSIWKPYEFLSARSIDRRYRMGIPVVENDLPVNPRYLEAIQAAGVRIHNKSKWLNGATIIADSVSASNLVSLPFVNKVSYVGKDISIKNPPNRAPRKRSYGTPIPEDLPVAFGYATQQLSVIGMGLPLQVGKKGDGKMIAVLDGGFRGADVSPFFDSIAVKGKLFEGWDFVERDKGIYESAQHGTSVLSVMGSNMPNYFMGSAPEASYFLIKTEDTGGEFPVEECNWIAGAEWADSIGADIINASLGYTTFNDPELNHRYEDLDGKTAIGSVGAAIAATKGMIVCNSAGNSGDNEWKHIGVPADAPGVIAVGAINPDMKRADFSSVGPSADGRIKPDLVALGEMVVVAGNSEANLGLSNGTSLASPLLAGSIASLWSDFPEASSTELLDAIFMFTDRYTPDNNLGYGIPDFSASWLYMRGYMANRQLNRAAEGVLFSTAVRNADCSLLFFYRESSGMPEQVFLRSSDEEDWRLTRFSMQGDDPVLELFLHPEKQLSKGAYELKVVFANYTTRYRVFKF